jgi:hypothetical protein
LPGQEKKIIFLTKDPQSTILQFKTLNAL